LLREESQDARGKLLLEAREWLWHNPFLRYLQLITEGDSLVGSPISTSNNLPFNHEWSMIRFMQKKIRNLSHWLWRNDGTETNNFAL